ncbi:MAG: UvrD-helicase domain-containing protein [Hydrogenothermaceae bacterium]|nr:UvrD-helicase domain-containing protein [Hydrogenothermaceae bacterium]
MLEDILHGLNDRQIEAVLYFDSPLLVLAGAGSGKTKVITHKIMYLVKHLGLNINRILAITFTNKAANEMKERVGKVFGESPPWIMTFHSLCVRILRTEAEKVGFERNFTIYDEEDSKKIIKKVLKNLNIDEEKIKPEKLRDIISKAKQEEDPEELIDLQSISIPMIIEIYRKYQEELKSANALDFDDLLVKSVKLLLKNEDALNRWQGKFDYILVDEYQDTNKIQHRLLKLLVGSKKGLTIVGDPAQCIYTWRGATPENILEFEKSFPDTKVIKLERNYRSTKRILDCANTVISKSSGRWQNKILKLWTDKEGEEEIQLKILPTEKEESSFIAQTIKSKGYRYSEFAVLVRMSFLTRNLEEAMLRYGIPYQIVGGLKFYERAEIKDILSYLKVAFNPKDFAGFERSITTPPRGIGEKTIQTISSYLKVDWIQALSDSTEALSKKAKEEVKKYIKLIEHIREHGNTHPVETVRYLLREINFEDFLKKEYEKDWEDRLQNVEELISALEEVEKTGKSLQDFLEETTLSQAQDTIDENETVKIMTIHAAKGLEFKTVFLAGLEEGIFPSGRAFDDPSQMEEERRLFYVAITRAKEELFLTLSKERHSFSNKPLTAKPSRFLKEIKEFLQKPATSNQKLSNSVQFKIGQLVKHDIFGNGVIKSIVRNRAVIIFEKVGEKTIDLSFVKPA